MLLVGQLLRLASLLDQKGDHAKSDKVDSYLIKLSQNMDEVESSDLNVQDFQKEFEIPEANLAKLHDKINAINKIITKLQALYPDENMELATYTIIGQTQRKDTRVNDDLWSGASNNAIDKWIPYVKVLVTGSAPRLSGWNFVARILHGSDDSGGPMNTFLGVPGKEIPDQYKRVGPVCEHCNQNRNRKDTFILHHPERGYCQVGSTCLADFLGNMSPQQMASYLQMLNDLGGGGEDDWDDEKGGRYERGRIETSKLCEISAFLADKFGYVSRAKSEQTGAMATSEVLRYLTGLQTMDEYVREHLKRYTDAYKQLSDEEREYYKVLGQESVAWAKALSEQENPSDFDWNMSASANQQLVNPKAFGITSYIPAGYKRHLEKLQKSQAEGEQMAQNKPVTYGRPGDKFAAPVNLVSVKPIQTMYGTSVIHNFKDPTGRTLVWFASGGRIGEPGEQFPIAATIKEFKDYQGKEQIVIKNVKRLEDGDLDENYQLVKKKKKSL